MTDAVTGARLPCGQVIVGDRAFIAESARLAVPSEATIRRWLLEPELAVFRQVTIGGNTIVLDDVVVQEGTEIGGDCYIDRAVHVGFDCHIGDSCRVEYRAQICDRVAIGAGCVIGGFLCDGSTLGEECVVLGSLVHGVRNPDLPWGQYEPDPVLEQRVFVGRGAVVVGGVRVGAGTYVAANATVTKDVPPDHVVVNTNEFVSIDDWPGPLERKHWGGHDPLGWLRR
jgi:acetyltransferase-like isoleucine patch superfamily enzyme